MATACSTSRFRSRMYGGFGRDLLYISQPGAPSGWVAWDGRAYVWMDED